MVEQIVGKLRVTADDRFAIAVSRYNEEVTRPLLSGAVETLVRHGVAESHITVAWVPGAFELPVVATKLANSHKYSAVIALGAVVQGDTDHHDYINHAVAQGLTVAAQNSGVPVLFGVLTCRNMDQALQRAGGQMGNKGAEAALAALETANVLKQLAER
ncbi:6,7-dimethyl-8-ribityllumazine synthase [Planctomicrobium sp. SH664]|uniref:6,7-dimethyl-8-ribityllumazine synthase n=1 Tax=Planctomicrobium sp. SH664 TaxID=3448125 RepID=UPI003F5AF0F2